MCKSALTSISPRSDIGKPVLEFTEYYYQSFLPHLTQKVALSSNFTPHSGQNVCLDLDFFSFSFLGAGGCCGGTGGCCTGAAGGVLLGKGTFGVKNWVLAIISKIPETNIIIAAIRAVYEQ